ncbi:MAG: hypothetical protein QOG46_1411 [Pseudonocardiales bacterium]|nr:hypothetical protein [Pseudonocardiales bacterium]
MWLGTRGPVSRRTSAWLASPIPETAPRAQRLGDVPGRN